LQDLPSRIVAQALAAKDADVEWRRMCALTTAWEIHAREQHLKYLHMLFEHQCHTYGTATSESLGVTMKELAGRSARELKGNIVSSIAAYVDDVKAFSVGDEQFDLIESTAVATRMYFHPPTSDVATDDCL
jgi:hypothetical protein